VTPRLMGWNCCTQNAARSATRTIRHRLMVIDTHSDVNLGTL
jgi:hypothetical protein